jgi:hypothetical protein
MKGAIRYRTKGGSLVIWKPTGRQTAYQGQMGSWECRGCHCTEDEGFPRGAEMHAENCNAC